MRMSSNNVRPITITEGFVVFKFHAQLLRFLSETLGYSTAVSSDSRPPNPNCLTAIIVFDI